MTAPRNTTRQRVVRFGRAVVFAAILLLIHRHHNVWLADQSARLQWSDQLGWIQESEPAATQLNALPEDSTAAEVVDDDGAGLGVVLKTLPAADHIVGFSGPTDLALLFDPSEHVSAVQILSSRDTVEHVQAIENDEKFLQSLTGKHIDALREGTDIDAVSGATLTSLAILEGIRTRLREFTPAIADSEVDTTSTAPLSLRFPDPPLPSAVRLLFPDAAETTRDNQSAMIWSVLDADGNTLGKLLRTSPAADNLQGLQYQGPTSALVALSDDGSVAGFAIGSSYENEPYIDYVREDEYFRSLFNDRSLQELAKLNVDDAGIEGVSGATMSSRFVAESLFIAARARLDEIAASAQPPTEENESDTPVASRPRAVDWHVSLRDVSTVFMVVFGAVLATTRLRRHRWLRVAFQFVLIAWLGLINGDMLSQALLVGWSQNGVPWRTASGLAFLTAAALLVPLVTGRNAYCSHVCPHGALQHLVRNRLPWQLRLNRRLQRMLRWIPSLLLIWVVAIGLLHLAFSAVDIEPFDAWVFSIAGAATITIAIAGLVASLFLPMAYCRFGCPTGALLEYLAGRGSGGKSIVPLRDGIAIALLVSAVAVNWLST